MENQSIISKHTSSIPRNQGEKRIALLTPPPQDGTDKHLLNYMDT